MQSQEHASFIFNIASTRMLTQLAPANEYRAPANEYRAPASK